MKNKIKELALRFGRNYLYLDEKLHIQSLDNGYVMGNRYYQTVSKMMPDLQEKLEKYFEQDKQ